MAILVVSLEPSVPLMTIADQLPGAWAARYLALLISLIGLPKNGDEKLFSRIHKACDNNTIWEDGAAAKLMSGYECKYAYPTVFTQSNHV